MQLALVVGTAMTFRGDFIAQFAVPVTIWQIPDTLSPGSQ